MHFSLPQGITLTELRLTDAEDIYQHLQDPAVVRYLLLSHPYPRDQADQWVARVRAAEEGGAPQTLWAIRETSGRLIGQFELRANRAPVDHTAEVGYWLGRPWWGRGIMTSVIRAMVDHAFRETPVVRITAPIYAPNLASARVLEKAGFVLEAPLLRKKYRRDGQFLDGKLYACVRGAD